MRNKTATTRPRPKTIHVDAGADLDSGALTPSRGKKGSSSNLSTGTRMDVTWFSSVSSVISISWRLIVQNINVNYVAYTYS